MARVSRRTWSRADAGTPGRPRPRLRRDAPQPPPPAPPTRGARAAPSAAGRGASRLPAAVPPAAPLAAPRPALAPPSTRGSSPRRAGAGSSTSSPPTGCRASAPSAPSPTRACRPSTGSSSARTRRSRSRCTAPCSQPRSVAQARACFGEYGHAFEAAEARTGVPAEVVAAILHVETRCGRNTGDEHRALRPRAARDGERARQPRAQPRPARRAATARSTRCSSSSCARAPRSSRRSSTPRSARVFELAERWQHGPALDPRLGVGRLRATRSSCRRATCASAPTGTATGASTSTTSTTPRPPPRWFLASHGWQGRLARVEQRRVIWHYNRSDAYIDAVLGLADELGPGPADGRLPVVEAAH